MKGGRTPYAVRNKRQQLAHRIAQLDRESQGQRCERDAKEGESAVGPANGFTAREVGVSVFVRHLLMH